MTSYIPVIDIFAGPGGLGEGFSSYKFHNGGVFKVKLSIEKDVVAHQTLELRAFYRQFSKKLVPSEYYEYLKGEISRVELFDKFPEESCLARDEAWRATLGEDDRRGVRTRINKALDGASHWVLIGGPPCQAYSLVGRSRMLGGYNGKYETDPRHFLYKEYLHILADHQPPVFVMENVKGLLSSRLQQQKTFDRILTDLRNPVMATGRVIKNPPSYKLFSISTMHSGNLDEIKPDEFVVRSEEYGIPQARHRIIILGIRADILSRHPEILKKVENQANIDDVIGDLPKLRSGLSREKDSSDEWRKAITEIEQTAWFDALHSDIKNGMREALRKVKSGLSRGDSFISFIVTPRKYYEWYVDEKLGGVCNHETRIHIREDLHRYFFASVYAKVKGRSPKLGDFPEVLLPKHANVLDETSDIIFNDRFRVQISGRPSTTVVSHISKDGHYYIHYDPSQCRSLTVREAARLQTFPDNYFFEGNRTDQYRQIGNAVPPMLAKQIAEIVYKVFRSLGHA